MFSFESLLPRLLLLPLTIISLSIHEWAHAWSAYRLGDDTAAREGRLTLNPVSHIDVFGTLILPLLGVPFGWAKPVPVNPARFRRDVSMGKGMAITAAAGPLSNVVIAVITAFVLGLAARFELLDRGGALWQVLLGGVVGDRRIPGLLQLNVGLAIFNLIPLPPLDGSRIAAWLMPYNLRNQWHALEQFAPFLLLGIFFFGGRLVSGPILALTELLLDLARLIA